MARLVSDEVLNTVGIVGKYADVTVYQDRKSGIEYITHKEFSGGLWIDLGKPPTYGYSNFRKAKVRAPFYKVSIPSSNMVAKFELGSPRWYHRIIGWALLSNDSWVAYTKNMIGYYILGVLALIAMVYRMVVI